MFSRIAKQHQDMAFAPYKNRLARATAARYASETLAAYVQGQEKLYAIQDVLNELEILFHEGATIPIALIREGLVSLDEDRRASLFEKAAEMIDRQVRSDRDQAL